MVERRYRQTVRSIDLWSVVRISACFYLCALIVTVVAGAVLWSIASAIGTIANVEDFIEGLLGYKNFRFLSWQVLQAVTFVGLSLVCLMVVCTVLAAAFYNLFADLLGGVEIVVTEEEPVGR